MTRVGNRNHVLNVLGRNVRKQRVDNALTQEALGERANLDPTYISGIERGMRNPSVLSVIRIAKALRVTTSKLMENVDDNILNHVSNGEVVSKHGKKI